MSTPAHAAGERRVLARLEVELDGRAVQRGAVVERDAVADVVRPRGVVVAELQDSTSIGASSPSAVANSGSETDDAMMKPEVAMLARNGAQALAVSASIP